MGAGYITGTGEDFYFHADFDIEELFGIPPIYVCTVTGYRAMFVKWTGYDGGGSASIT